MTMLERVAQAMAETEPGWVKAEHYIVLARAAVTAMREPTPEMFLAAVKAYQRKVGGLDYDESWRAMIDEALKEGEDGK